MVNAFELLGTPGEWYFDRPAGRIYYTPRYGEDMAAADVEAAQAGTLIEGNGTQVRPVTGLIFKGIRFEYTSLPRSFDVDYTRSRPAGAPAAAVRFTFAGGIQFLEDEFVHLGTPALDLGPGLEGGTVEACVFGDISWTALRIADASQVRVDNSRFSYVDFAQDDGAAIELDHSQAVVIEHDQFDHYPRFAILPQGSQFGANHKAMNLMMPPAIDFDGRPPEQDPRDSAAPDAGVLAAYRSVLAERFCSPTVPHAPGNVSAAPGDRLAYVTWDPPCLDGSSAVESYTVASSGGATITVTAAAFRKTGYVIFSGLENGHAMNFTVAATNATGAGPHSIPTANVIPQRKKKHKPPPPPKAAGGGTPGGRAGGVRGNQRRPGEDRNHSAGVGRRQPGARLLRRVAPFGQMGAPGGMGRDPFECSGPGGADDRRIFARPRVDDCHLGDKRRGRGKGRHPEAAAVKGSRRQRTGAKFRSLFIHCIRLNYNALRQSTAWKTHVAPH